jgi:hypothetical protein
MRLRLKGLLFGITAGALVAAAPSLARACGCFAQPSPAQPVVQAGERILFAHEGGQVVAYIQIQYSGQADRFGWLVPLPSVPTLQLGSDELFTQLGATTQPSFQLTTTRYFCGGGSSSSSGGCVGFGASAPEAYGAGGGKEAAADAGLDIGMSPVVVQSSLGPFDYAVLKADDKSEMFNWLSANNYFVPDATGQAVAPYIHPGGYFLALKLRAGESAGDIVPIVLRYTSDLPMIPITLTSVGAVPDMGILVWVLGNARAIPRNYYHAVVNELPIWGIQAQYPDQVKQAIHEAPKRHAFITEYAGPSSVMKNTLDYPGRFGSLDVMRTIQTPSDYLVYLKEHGYSFDTTLFAVLEKYIPEPQSLVQAGVSERDYYQSYDQWAMQGSGDAGAPVAFDPVGLTNEIDGRIVQPIRYTASLFDTYPYLTRLYTVLSPEDMNADPVFSENPDLPMVPLVHTATVSIPCNGNSWLKTDQGFIVSSPVRLAPFQPGALRIETLREAGLPEVVVDNQPAIAIQYPKVDTSNPTGSSSSSSSGCACNLGHRSFRADAWLLAACSLLALGLRSRRRARAERRRGA